VTKNYIGPIKDALGPERALVFMETVASLGLGPDDPELLLAAAMASTVVSLAEIPRAIERERQAVEKLFARALSDVDLKIAESMTAAVDEMVTEVRTMARELAVGEYTAAASLRAAAINDEVRALRAATAELVRERQAAEALGIATAQTPGQEAAVSPTARGGVALTPAVALVLALVLVLGAVLGAALTKRSYAGWQPPHGRRGAAVLRGARGPGSWPRARAVAPGGARAGAGREAVVAVHGPGESSSVQGRKADSGSRIRL
jgi:hypothetical protein